MLGELIPCGGGDPIPLLKHKLLVGRRSHCDIQLQFPNVSSHHCQLELIKGFWRVEDLGSSNGIKVNGERHESKWLMPGDVLSIAKQRYEVHYRPPDGQRPPEDEINEFSHGLLEKAGLQRTAQIPLRPPASPSPDAAAPPPPATPPRPSDQSLPDDEETMKWLSEL